jgi:hypothetical protein
MNEHQLSSMKLKELQTHYFKVFGKPTASRNKPWLIKKLTAAFKQEDTEPTQKIKEKKATVSVETKEPPVAIESGANDQSDNSEPVCKAVLSVGLTVGTVIEKTYKGKVIAMTIRSTGFEIDGIIYKSLSGAAKAVAGCNWNGKVFFGLKKRQGGAA